MRTCIYCGTTKDDGEFTLEHVIPQFLGGAYAPDWTKTREVCKACNSNLGLFVDAAFEKHFVVYNKLNRLAHAYFDPAEPSSLPLHCMGPVDESPPGIQEHEICELWLGPLGEQVYWIRPNDERLYWYSGGNPRTAKSVRSRAYFMFSQRSEKNVALSWYSFRDAFQGYKVNKVMCTKVAGADPQSIGFSSPDALDNQRVAFFESLAAAGAPRKIQLALYERFDVRFMAKLGLGMAHALFGPCIANTSYGEELRQALWFREGNAEPGVRGTGAFSDDGDNTLAPLCGAKHLVVISAVSVGTGVAITLNMDADHNWVVMCADSRELDPKQLQRLGEGLCVVLCKPIQTGLTLTLPQLVAHNSGNIPHPELTELQTRADANADYFRNL